MIKAVIFDCFGVVLDIMRGTENKLVMDLLQELKPNYKLGMLTNVSSRYSLDQRFREGELDDLFEAVVVSGDVGWDKPAPEIYIMTAEKLAVKPNECLFIDDIPAFVAAAEKLGMVGFHYTNTEASIVAIKKILADSSQAVI